MLSYESNTSIVHESQSLHVAVVIVLRRRSALRMDEYRRTVSPIAKRSEYDVRTLDRPCTFHVAAGPVSGNNKLLHLLVRHQTEAYYSGCSTQKEVTGNNVVLLPRTAAEESGHQDSAE